MPWFWLCGQRIVYFMKICKKITLSYPSSKKYINNKFTNTITVAIRYADILSAKEFARLPIIDRLLVNWISGKTAKGSCRLKIIWLKIIICARQHSPNIIMPISAGIIVIKRPMSLRAHAGIFILINPSKKIQWF